MWKRNKKPVQPGAEKRSIPDTARPFALVSGAREAYLNFLRNLTPPILLITILMLTGDKLYQRLEGLGVFMFTVLAITIILSFYNNVAQLGIKISESYEAESFGLVITHGISGVIDSLLVIAIATVCFAVVVAMGWISADQIIKNKKAAEQAVIQQKHTPASATPFTKTTP